jgi:hypothetical protein
VFLYADVIILHIVTLFLVPPPPQPPLTSTYNSNYYYFFPHGHSSYSLMLQELKLHALRIRRHRLDASFLTPLYFGLKFCPSLLVILRLRVPARYIRDSALFNVCSSCNNCPSARCASAASVRRDVDVFGARNVFLNRFYNILLLFGCCVSTQISKN